MQNCIARLPSLAAVFCGVFLLSTTAFSDPAAAEETTTARVMSYNIRYLNKRDGDDVWGNRNQAVASALKDADVFGLQEAVKEQIADLEKALPEFHWYAVGRDDGKDGGEASPVAWRKDRFDLIAKGTFWLSETPTVVGSVGWDAALPRVASWVRLSEKKSGNELLVVNTHFDHRGAKARAQAAILVRDWIAREAPSGRVALLGDFNATQKGVPIQNLLEQVESQKPLVDAREHSKTPDPGPNTTWNGFRELEPDRRIDFIFTRELTVKKFETLNPKTKSGRFASDHLPIAATIELTH